tara:strand:+ start:4084 stop:4698 length:615 start_codon:yes stop_codon:yes gene_type:complete
MPTFLEVMHTGPDSPCEGNAYITTIDGEDTNNFMKHDNPETFKTSMTQFCEVHKDDYNKMVKMAKKRGVLKWVAGDGSNKITHMQCVEEVVKPEVVIVKPEVVIVKPEVVQIEAVQMRVVMVAPPPPPPPQPQIMVCKKQEPCYLGLATPGMTRQLGSVKTRAFVNGGNLPGEGRCNNYCISKFASTNLTAVDIAKSRALASFL